MLRWSVFGASLVVTGSKFLLCMFLLFTSLYHLALPISSRERFPSKRGLCNRFVGCSEKCHVSTSSSIQQLCVAHKTWYIESVFVQIIRIERDNLQYQGSRKRDEKSKSRRIRQQKRVNQFERVEFTSVLASVVLRGSLRCVRRGSRT